MTKIDGGGYEMTQDADIIIYTAGPSVKSPEDDRMSIAEENIELAREVCNELNKYNRDAFLIVISNPVDIIVSALVKFTGRPRNKVIGTGTRAYGAFVISGIKHSDEEHEALICSAEHIRQNSENLFVLESIDKPFSNGLESSVM